MGDRLEDVWRYLARDGVREESEEREYFGKREVFRGYVG